MLLILQNQLSLLSGKEHGPLQTRIGEAILHKMRIVEPKVRIRFPECNMVQNIRYPLPLERHEKKQWDREMKEISRHHIRG